MKNWVRDRLQQQREERSRTFEKSKREYEKKREERYRNSAGHGGVEGDLPEKFLSLLPTPAKFNATFDKALSKLPDGADIVKKFPRKYWPFLHLSRVDKPIGSWLLFLPSAWGICMAPGFISLPLLGLFGVGQCPAFLTNTFSHQAPT